MGGHPQRRGGSPFLVVDRNSGGVMRFELLEPGPVRPDTRAICRISALGIPWRVQVEAYPGPAGWSGRLRFEPEAVGTRHGSRVGPMTLRGRTHEDLLDAAYQLPERRIRELLHALG